MQKLSCIYKCSLALINEVWKHLLNSVTQQLRDNLQNTLQHDICLKSVACYGFNTLGRITSFVAPKYLGIVVVSKNSLTIAHTKGPIILHDDLQKPLLYPSGPGDFTLGIENMPFFISQYVNWGHKFNYCSVVTTGPFLIASTLRLHLRINCFPSKFE